MYLLITFLVGGGGGTDTGLGAGAGATFTGLGMVKYLPPQDFAYTSLEAVLGIL
jgi:hypothetical protein